MNTLSNTKERGNKDMVAYIGGTFDRLHFGHVNLFGRVKRMGYKVVVSINSDSFVKAYKPELNIQPENERYENVLNCSYVDSCFLCDKETQRLIIQTISPDVVVIGTDWLKPEILPQLGIDEKFLWDNNIGLLILARTPSISSTELRKNEPEI